MGRPETVSLKYTSRQLLGYVNDPNSCVRRITDRLHIGLPPAGLNNFKEAVVDSVNSEKIGRFDAKLDGIVLDVRNIKVLGNAFAIHTDHPELHVDLLADLHVFRPTVGASIRGIIKHIAKSHISVTIHRVFNVAIRLAAGSAAHSTLAVNAEIAIRVTDYDLKDTIPYIAGVLDQPLALPSALKKATATNKKKLSMVSPTQSDEDEESDPDDDNRSVMVDSRVAIKKEPLSDRSDHSDSDTSAHDSEPDSQSEERRTKSAVLANCQANPSSASDDSGSEAEVPPPKIISIKQEKPVTSSSEDDSGTEVPIMPFPTKSALRTNVKSEKNVTAVATSDSSTSSDEEDVKPSTETAAMIKRELLLAASPAKRKSTAAVGGAASLALKRIKRQLDDDANKTPAKTGRASRNNDSLDETSAFATPGLSSTMLPESRIKRKSIKK